MTDWSRIEELAASDRSPNAVALLELRARVERLEAMRETEKAAILDVYKLLDKLKTGHESNWSRIVKLEDGAACPHIVTSDEGTSWCRLAESVPPIGQSDLPANASARPAPIGLSLIDEVAQAIGNPAVGSRWIVEARAAINVIVAALREHGSPTVADWLEQEAER